MLVICCVKGGLRVSHQIGYPVFFTGVVCVQGTEVMGFRLLKYRKYLGVRNIFSSVQNEIDHIIYPDTSYTDAMTKVKLVSIKDRLNHLNRTFFRKITNNESHRLHYVLPNPLKKRNLRNTNKFEPPKCRTKHFKTIVFPLLFTTTSNSF